MRLLPAALVLPLLLAALPARGQDLSGQLEEVQKLIEEKDYVTALEDLRFIAQQIQEFRLREAAPLFPPPPEGWVAEPPVRTSRDSDLWSRRLQVRRLYRPAELTGKVEIEYDFGSPLIPRVSLSLNPVYLAADPQAEPVEVSGHPGRLWFNADTGEGEMVLVVSERVLVSITGRGVSGRATLKEFASRVELAALASFMPP